MIGQLDSVDLEIRNHVSSCTAEARQMKDESEKKENQLSTVEKEADQLLKVLPCVVFLEFILDDPWTNRSLTALWYGSYSD
jgi:hypothetical protein